MTPRILWVFQVVSSFLRKFIPFLRIGKRVVVTRYKDVVDILARDRDFTIAQINGPTINALSGPFILAMDCPHYAADAARLKRAVKHHDPANIETLVTRSAEAIVAGAQPKGSIDVIADLGDIVSVRLVNDYFGIPGPNGDDERMREWMRVLFRGVFLNLSNKKTIYADALEASHELADYLDEVIRDGSARNRDNFLGRLIDIWADERAKAKARGSPPALDDTWVRRNISGMILGAAVTTSKTTGLIVDQLMRRPAALAAASEAAKADDMERLRQISYEALRFNPHNPIAIRYCVRDTAVGIGLGRHNIKTGTTVYAVTLSAMMDSSNFPNPKEFSADRLRSRYLHFGHGLHSCFGEYINQLSLPRIIAPLVRLENLRRRPGRSGTLQFEGPFPRHMVLEFNP